MNILKFKSLAVLASISLFLSSCDKNDDTVESEDKGYNSGYFVVNEGGHNANNGSITHISDDGTVTNNLFASQNGFNLGDVVQSMTVSDDKAFIVVNNSQKVEVVDVATFNSDYAVTGLSYPRYVAIDGENGYVTNGNYAGKVYVFDINSGLITDSVIVGNGPENLLIYEDKLYVGNSGGFTTDSTLSIIDLNTNTVSKTLQLSDKPTDLVLDGNQNLWVVCRGNSAWDGEETVSMLYKINPTNDEILASFQIGELGDHVSDLDVSDDGQKIYFDNDGVRSLSIGATSDISTLLVSGNFYGFGINPSDDKIHVASSDFVSASTAYTYDNEGNILDSAQVGIGANSFVFIKD